MGVWDRQNSGWGVGSEKLGLGGWSRGVGSGELRDRRVGVKGVEVGGVGVGGVGVSEVGVG